MLFSSYTFLFQFLPATLLAFAAARRHSPRAGIMVLVAASLFFYGAWRPVYMLLFLVSIAVMFCLELRVEDALRRREPGAHGGGGWSPRGWVVWGGRAKASGLLVRRGM